MSQFLDPMIAHWASANLLVEFARACEQSTLVAPSISLPWLAMHGGDDAIAPPHGSEILIDRLTAADKRLEIIRGARHEIHNEVPQYRERFIETMVGWIGERVA